MPCHTPRLGLKLTYRVATIDEGGRNSSQATRVQQLSKPTPPTPACIVQHADARLDRVHYCNFALRASSAAVPRQDNLARRRQSGSVRSYRSGPGIN